MIYWSTLASYVTTKSITAAANLLQHKGQASMNTGISYRQASYLREDEWSMWVLYGYYFIGIVIVTMLLVPIVNEVAKENEGSSLILLLIISVCISMLAAWVWVPILVMALMVWIRKRRRTA